MACWEFLCLSVAHVQRKSHPDTQPRSGFVGILCCDRSPHPPLPPSPRPTNRLGYHECLCHTPAVVCPIEFRESMRLVLKTPAARYIYRLYTIYKSHWQNPMHVVGAFCLAASRSIVHRLQALLYCACGHCGRVFVPLLCVHGGVVCSMSAFTYASTHTHPRSRPQHIYSCVRVARPNTARVEWSGTIKPYAIEHVVLSLYVRCILYTTTSKSVA